MAKPTSPGDLKENIRVETRTSASDGGGGQTAAWSTYIDSRRVSLLPGRAAGPLAGKEEVLAARLQGITLWDCWIRFDSLTSAITTDMRVVDNRDESRVWNVRFVEDMDGARRWLLMVLERGVA